MKRSEHRCSEKFIAYGYNSIQVAIPIDNIKKSRVRCQQTETFNMPWSVEEQHLLERLLIEIPRGEKHRYRLYTETYDPQADRFLCTDGQKSHRE